VAEVMKMVETVGKAMEVEVMAEVMAWGAA
jgi:hypothetical protein